MHGTAEDEMLLWTGPWIGPSLLMGGDNWTVWEIW